MAFKTSDSDDNGPDTTGDMLQEATKLSRNLSDFNPDTASEQFARQAFVPRQSTFDAETEDSTEDRVSIKDPTEKVFGRSTVEDAQKERQTTLPDLNVGKKEKEPPGLFGFKFDRPITKEDFLGDRFKTKDTGVNIDKGRGSELGDQYRFGDFTPDTTFGTETVSSYKQNKKLQLEHTRYNSRSYTISN